LKSEGRGITPSAGNLTPNLITITMRGPRSARNIRHS
jgi:hypothetical protein